MWPKILLKLLELAPHASQLVPLADKYLTQRSAMSAANQAGLDAVAALTDARGDFEQVGRAQAALYRQVQEQNGQISGMRDELNSVRDLVEYNNRQLKELELRVASQGLWMKICFVILILMLSTVLGMLVRMR